jgi:hypothetical protein
MLDVEAEMGGRHRVAYAMKDQRVTTLIWPRPSYELGAIHASTQP